MSDSLYPLTPGYQNTDTSRDAAEQVESKAAVIRLKVLGLVRAAAKHSAGVLLPGVKPVVKNTPTRNAAGVPVGITARETADMLDENDDNVHPRFSELRKAGLIRDSGVRRVNAHSGKKAIAWTPGDDPDKPQDAPNNAPPAKPAQKAAYVRGLAASYYTVQSAENKDAALQALRRRLAELEPGNPDWNWS